MSCPSPRSSICSASTTLSSSDSLGSDSSIRLSKHKKVRFIFPVTVYLLDDADIYSASKKHEKKKVRLSNIFGRSSSSSSSGGPPLASPIPSPPPPSSPPLSPPASPTRSPRAAFFLHPTRTGGFLSPTRLTLARLGGREVAVDGGIGAWRRRASGSRLSRANNSPEELESEDEDDADADEKAAAVLMMKRDSVYHERNRYWLDHDEDAD